MKKWARFGCILVVILIVFSFSTIVFAADAPLTVKVDDKTIAFDTPPKIVNGRTMVPLKQILEALGLELNWDAKNRVVNASNKEYTIVLPIDAKSAIVNGKVVELDVPATIINGRTMVPAGFISKAAGADTQWDAANRTVIIKSANYSKTITNNNNLSNINNSNVNLTNNNVDNSVNNSNNTVNNYDYSTNITNNVTNVTVNTVNEDLLRQILKKLEGTNLVSVKPEAAANINSETKLSDYTVNKKGIPVIIPLNRQNDLAWKDGMMAYDELTRNSANVTLSVILPEGLEAGWKPGANPWDPTGDSIKLDIFDEDGNKVGHQPHPIAPLELQKGIAVVELFPENLILMKDGEKYAVRANVTRGNFEYSSEYSEPVIMTFKDDPTAHRTPERIKIAKIRPLGPKDAGDSLYKGFSVEGTDNNLPAFIMTCSYPFPFETQNKKGMYDFLKALHGMPTEFILKAAGEQDIRVVRLVGMSNTESPMFIREQEKLKKGVKYSLMPVNRDTGTQWFVNEGISYTAD